jgi:protein SCO1/2
MHFRLTFLAFAAMILGANCAAQSRAQLEYELQGVDVVERIGEAIPMDLSFTDDNNQTVRLGQYFKAGRPVLITLNYSNCPRLCSYQLTDLSKALRDMDWVPGKEFVAVTVSVDPTEDYKAAKQSKLRYLGIVNKAEADKGWHFLTTTSDEDIHKLADALGFSYKIDPETGEYRHKAAMFVIHGDGKISHYMRDMGYLPADVQGQLQASAEGKFAEPSADDTGFGLNCFAFEYTDNMGRAFFMMRMGGVGILVFLFSFLGYWWIRELRKPRAPKLDGQIQPEAT